MVGSYDFWVQFCKRFEVGNFRDLSDEALTVVDANNAEGFAIVKVNEIGKTWKYAPHAA